MIPSLLVLSALVAGAAECTALVDGTPATTVSCASGFTTVELECDATGIEAKDGRWSAQIGYDHVGSLAGGIARWNGAEFTAALQDGRLRYTMVGGDTERTVEEMCTRTERDRSTSTEVGIELYTYMKTGEHIEESIEDDKIIKKVVEEFAKTGTYATGSFTVELPALSSNVIDAHGVVEVPFLNVEDEILTLEGADLQGAVSGYQVRRQSGDYSRGWYEFTLYVYADSDIASRYGDAKESPAIIGAAPSTPYEFFKWDIDSRILRGNAMGAFEWTFPRDFYKTGAPALLASYKKGLKGKVHTVDTSVYSQVVWSPMTSATGATWEHRTVAWERMHGIQAWVTHAGDYSVVAIATQENQQASADFVAAEAKFLDDVVAAIKVLK